MNAEPGTWDPRSWKKRLFKRILLALAALVVLLTLFIGYVIVFILHPARTTGSVSVSFLMLTNHASSKRWALFSATNSTNRLLVRGRSELERRGATSNVVSVLQITRVDYLQPGQGIVFEIPCDGWLDPWRLRFFFSGQFHDDEAMVYECGCKLDRMGLIPDRWADMKWLPRHQEYEVTTAWVNDSPNAQQVDAPNERR